MDKYRLTNESMEYNGCVLWRIECLKTRRKGGWVQSEMNLSQTGESWIADNAKVYGEAMISDNAKVSDNAEIFGAARITEDAHVYGNAMVSDYATVAASARVYGEAYIEDAAQIYGNATVSGKALVAASAKVYDYASIEGHAQVYDNVHVYGHATIKDRAYVCKDAHIKGHTIVAERELISENIYNWEDVNAVSKLEISLLTGEKTAELYANGRHQIAVRVSLVASDKKMNPISISAKELFHHLEFVDEENNWLANGVSYTDQAGLYTSPAEAKAKKPLQRGVSAVVVYFSIETCVKAFKLCVRCKIKQWSKQNNLVKIKRMEYTTSIEHNNSQMATDYITITVLPKRAFIQSDIGVQTFVETDVNGIHNSRLTKYYVQFNAEEGLVIRHTSCIENKWFHYKQLGIYKGCTISTDTCFTADEKAVFTTKFEFTSSKFRKVQATNHDVDGVCFWVYQLWEGLLWSYYEWGREMCFSLYDQYGNEACIIAQAGEEEQLNFFVRVEEFNHE